MRVINPSNCRTILLFYLVNLSLSRPYLKTDIPSTHRHYNPEENIGAKVFLAEGDILIDRELYYSMLEWDDETDQLPGPDHDSLKDIPVKRTRQKRNVDSVYHLMWLNRSVPYEFDLNVGKVQRSLVREAMLVLESVSCVKFKKRTSQLDYVHILVPNLSYSSQGGCYSKVGRNGGRQDIGLSTICSFGTVVHELLHALGMWHEHNRRDRGAYINVIWDNIREDKQDNFHISKGQNQEILLNMSYDYGSIMHYANNTFTKIDSLPTLEAKKPLPLGVEMGQRTWPSQLDIEKLNALYMCDIVNCSHPGLIDNGYVLGTKFTVGSRVTYNCNSGYVLVGAHERLCLTIGQWSGDQPSCLPNTSSNPVHYCNFDKPRRSLCGWTQSSDDQIDWTLHSGATGTNGTGPYWDNTLNTASGVYLYVEASSYGAKPLNKGSQARLKSPKLDGTGHSTTCLVFYTYMYGKLMGSLTVYKQEDGDPETKLERLFMIDGDQGNKWRQLFLVLGKISRPFYLILEGSIGGYSSDIAIDDVTVGACKNFKPLATSGGLRHSLECSFDNNHLCQFIQDRHDTANWTIMRGRTPTYHTGPDCDPFNCSTGRYLYLEASYPSRTGDTAKLKTPVIGGQGPTCLSFYYHMHGRDIGSLSIKTISAISGNEYTLWFERGNHGNHWMTEHLEYNALEAYEISFEGVVGPSYRGDIAIDRISVTSGGCNGMLSFNCNFDHDLCGWLNGVSPGDTRDWTRHTGETDTPYTGPTTDRNNPDGYYLYVESSRSFPEDSARVISPAISQTQSGHCLIFWYHMYGTKTGNLTVLLQSEVGEVQVVWTQSGNHGNVWMQKKLYLTSFPSQHIHVIFEVKLAGSTGDTAIDDVSIHRGQCVTE